MARVDWAAAPGSARAGAAGLLRPHPPPKHPSRRNLARRGQHRRSPDTNKSKAAAAKRARATPSSPARRCSLEHASHGTYACPSFAAAPKPEALPMPTALLFRRSPSPPKMPALQAVIA
jgi:hypothetical protein